MSTSLFKKKNWYKPSDGNYIEVISPLDEKDIKELLAFDTIDRIQMQPPLDRFESTWKLLNEYFFTVRPEVELRIYGERELFKDLSFLELLSNVKRFAVDQWFLTDLTPITYLSQVETLSIGETKTARLSYAPLAELKKLKKLYINGAKKDINTISKLTTLELLSLRSVTLDSLEFLLPLKNLKELHIYLGGIRNYNLLPKIGKINTLTLCWIKELPETNFQPIAKMPYLQKLSLDCLPHIKSLAWLTDAKELKELYLGELKVLESIEGIEKLPKLEKLTIGTSAKNKTIEPIMKSKNLKELFLPLTWGRANLLKVHEQFPQFQIDKYIQSYDEMMKELKSSTKK